mmetsp:Transcript_53286/g.127735  ORF Transcript_53286/g.127735 Transcript_53286/m.127735 type:complete len:223 (-) Transcript_53286:349-1017(-)
MDQRDVADVPERRQDHRRQVRRGHAPLRPLLHPRPDGRRAEGGAEGARRPAHAREGAGAQITLPEDDGLVPLGRRPLRRRDLHREDGRRRLRAHAQARAQHASLRRGAIGLHRQHAVGHVHQGDLRAVRAAHGPDDGRGRHEGGALCRARRRRAVPVRRGHAAGALSESGLVDGGAGGVCRVRAARHRRDAPADDGPGRGPRHRDVHLPLALAADAAALGLG